MVNQPFDLEDVLGLNFHFTRPIIWGVDMLIETTIAHLGDCFLGNILKIFSKNILKLLKYSLY